jgi:1-aminocyclopropane-1-carboxylate deaminase/D-cysteine desulfhydrase-like pyridoxal-dependent ACC family enzyme
MLDFNTPTPIENITFKGFNLLLKRDDLISPHFSGNKARKILYYVKNLPDNVKKIVSYGSIQSNAMYSLSVFAKSKGLDFEYYANHIPSYLKENPDGNYKLAILNGAKIFEGYDSIKINNEDELLIKEGLSNQEAYYGIKELAKELVNQTNRDKEYQIFLPSGTGVTALFLSVALSKLSQNFKVFTTPCVGNASYLKKQFFEFEEDEKYHPTILDTEKKYHFGKLYKEFYQIWLELHRETGIEFDLLYDPKGWLVVLNNLNLFDNLLYIHQGGLLGNMTMLKRYKRKFGEDL